MGVNLVFVNCIIWDGKLDNKRLTDAGINAGTDGGIVFWNSLVISLSNWFIPPTFIHPNFGIKIHYITYCLQNTLSVFLIKVNIVFPS